MAMIERDVVLVGKDANGNTTVDLPITRLGNLEDTAETKSMPVSGDALAIVDSEADGEVKKISWSDVVNAVKDAVGGGDGSALEELKRALTEHEEDPDKHVAADDRAAWNETKEKMDAHAADGVIHVTAQEREKWNNAGGGSGGGNLVFTAETGELEDTAVEIGSFENAGAGWNHFLFREKFDEPPGVVVQAENFEGVVLVKDVAADGFLYCLKQQKTGTYYTAKSVTAYNSNHVANDLVDGMTTTKDAVKIHYIAMEYGGER